ncbi:MAG: phenylalanine--tRNA ligase subunit alpha [Candidatus Nanoarchaeia archaeon]
MDAKKTAESLSPVERKVFPVLEKVSGFDSIVSKSGLDNVEAMRALQWLQNKGLITVETKEQKTVGIDENGKHYKKKGLPERRFLDTLEGEMSVDEIVQESGLSKEEVNVSIGVLKKKGLIYVKKENGLFAGLSDTGKETKENKLDEEKLLEKNFPLSYGDLSKDEKEIVDGLKKRKKIVKVESTNARNVSLTKEGKDVLKYFTGEEMIEKLTPAMLKSGEWKNKKFRRYDVSINVPKKYAGKRHFVSQAIQYVKRIWMDMGFKEMTGDVVHTSFWDLDTLFVPQDHPAREEQDTFYVQDPSEGKLPSWYKKIKEVHEDGGDTGSKGWQNVWKEEIAKENLLRTHTTVLSAQTLKNLTEDDLPAKFFSVGRVYRNEALDWKHLFELHQVEGIVVDKEANLRNLKAYLKEFFGKMGFPDVRIRPAHFPYTEPSAEVDVYHPERKEWIELGGSGIFRPEVTKALFGIEVPVLAWGFGLERSVSMYYGITDIRDLYRNDLAQLRNIKYWMK